MTRSTACCCSLQNLTRAAARSTIELHLWGVASASAARRDTRPSINECHPLWKFLPVALTEKLTKPIKAAQHAIISFLWACSSVSALPTLSWIHRAPHNARCRVLKTLILLMPLNFWEMRAAPLLAWSGYCTSLTLLYDTLPTISLLRTFSICSKNGGVSVLWATCRFWGAFLNSDQLLQSKVQHCPHLQNLGKFFKRCQFKRTIGQLFFQTQYYHSPYGGKET